MREAIAPHVSQVAGFIAQRLREGGRRVGFRAALLEGRFPPPEAKLKPGMDDVFILDGQHSAAALEKAILRVEQRLETPDIKLVLLDEIGGIELTSPVFMSALERILRGQTPCFGVFKSRENLGRAAANLKLSSGHTALHARLEEKILSGGEIITISEQNREKTLMRVKKAAAKIFSNP